MPWFEMDCGCTYWNDGFVVREYCICDDMCLQCLKELTDCKCGEEE